MVQMLDLVEACRKGGINLVRSSVSFQPKISPIYQGEILVDMLKVDQPQHDGF